MPMATPTAAVTPTVATDYGDTLALTMAETETNQFPFQTLTVTVTKNPKMKMMLNPEVIQALPMGTNTQALNLQQMD